MKAIDFRYHLLVFLVAVGLYKLSFIPLSLSLSLSIIDCSKLFPITGHDTHMRSLAECSPFGLADGSLIEALLRDLRDGSHLGTLLHLHNFNIDFLRVGKTDKSLTMITISVVLLPLCGGPENHGT